MSEVLQRVAGVVPPIAVSAQGLMIRLADGREIIDGTGGAAVACIGHGNRKVRDAIAAQLDRVPYVHTMFFTVPATEELAHVLVGHKPGGLTKAMFLTGGSEAMEAALKITRQYHLERGEPDRTRFISRQLSYHGNTLGALGAGPDAARNGPFGPYVSDRFSSVSPAFAYHYRRAEESEAAYVARLAAELDAEFERLGPETVAGFIAETIVGSTAGAVTAPVGYFRAIREVCDRHGALLILDEVFCGMGRTGTMHAWEAEVVSPDIQTIAKGLGAGYQPIAAILVHAVSPMRSPRVRACSCTGTPIRAIRSPAPARSRCNRSWPRKAWSRMRGSWASGCSRRSTSASASIRSWGTCAGVACLPRSNWWRTARRSDLFHVTCN